MAITIAQGSPQAIWVPVKVPSITIYEGGIVTHGITALDEGVIMLPVAAGSAIQDDTYKYRPFGVVIGTNLKTPTWDSTYKCNTIISAAAADPHDGSAVEYVGVEGPYSKGDPIPMVKVAIIAPDTVLRAPLYNAAYGVGPNLLTATAGNTDGLQIVSNASQHTPVANLATIYCRTGSNAGCYRIEDNANTLTHKWDNAMPKDTVIGDTFVSVPLRPYGHSTIQFNSVATWVEVSTDAVANGTDVRIINVLRLDLREAGKEFVDFTFDIGEFGAYTTRA